MQQEERILKIGIDSIVPNRYQPRKKFDETELEELANSIKTYGILNPILVRKKEEKYEIIAGERRYRAAIKAGLKEVPAIEKNNADNQLAELALIENIQRQNLSPIEEANSYEEIMKLSNITQKELGDKLGKSQSSIANKLRLLALPEQIKEALLNRKISERHARSLIKVENESKQLELLNRIINEKLTVKDLDNIINEKIITEEEIQSAINDIMKSLNIAQEENEEQKEEKESDKMNNDNFFPNFNNTMVSNNNVSLNSMNMQSMGSTPTNPAPETVMPTVGSPSTMSIQEPMMENTQQQMIEPPLFGGPTLETPVVDTPLFNQPTPEIQPMMDTTLFGGNFQNPSTSTPINNFTPIKENIVPAPDTIPSPIPTFGFDTPVNQSVVPETTTEPPVLDPPLFNLPETPVLEQPVVEVPTQPQNQEIEVNQTTEVVPVTLQPEETNLNESFYDVPVNISPVIEETSTNKDKLSQVQELLSQNGISYKTYSNETGHCIIIEL